MRRYRCVDDACGWQGLLPRLSRRAPRAVRGVSRPLLSRWRLWAVPLLLLALVGLGVAAVAVQALRGDTPPPPVPTGESHYGRPLPAAHPLQVKFVQQLAALPPVVAVPSAEEAAAELPMLTLRRHCAWGKPGGNPYRGTVEQALHAAALPDEVVQAIARQVRAGEVADRLDIRTGSIRAQRSGREFNPGNMAMTYGKTLCLNTRVNFVPGHVEKASLYEAADRQGRLHAVMVPDVCGNVTVIGQSDASRRQVAAGVPPEDWRWMPAQLDWDPTRKTGAEGTLQSVPEPGTLAAVALGLALLALQRVRRRVR